MASIKTMEEFREYCDKRVLKSRELTEKTIARVQESIRESLTDGKEYYSERYTIESNEIKKCIYQVEKAFSQFYWKMSRADESQCSEIGRIRDEAEQKMEKDLRQITQVKRAATTITRGYQYF